MKTSPYDLLLIFSKEDKSIISKMANEIIACSKGITYTKNSLMVQFEIILVKEGFPKNISIRLAEDSVKTFALHQLKKYKVLFSRFFLACFFLYYLI